MGYSCSAKASFVREAITQLVGEKSSNALPGNAGFWEIGREQPDGAITGTVFKTVKRYTDAERAEAAKNMSGGGVEVKPDWVGDPAVRYGSFKITADGKIARFPLLPKDLKAKAEEAGAKKYAEVYGG